MFDLCNEGLRHFACSINNSTSTDHIGPLSHTSKLVHAWYYCTFDEQLEKARAPLHGEPGPSARAPLHGEPGFAAWSCWSSTRFLPAVLRRWKWSVVQFSVTVWRVLLALIGSWLGGEQRRGLDPAFAW